MKYLDWGWRLKNILVECFSRHASGPVFRIKATTLEDAEDQVKAVLEKHHADFIRRAQNNYTVKYKEEVNECPRQQRSNKMRKVLKDLE